MQHQLKNLAVNRTNPLIFDNKPATVQIKWKENSNVAVFLFRKVYIPTDLEMKDYIPTVRANEQTTYNLYGVVSHYGSQISGHYTAICK